MNQRPSSFMLLHPLPPPPHTSFLSRGEGGEEGNRRKKDFSGVGHRDNKPTSNNMGETGFT